MLLLVRSDCVDDGKAAVDAVLQAEPETNAFFPQGRQPVRPGHNPRFRLTRARLRTARFHTHFQRREIP